MSNSDVQNDGDEEIDFALLKKDINEFYNISEENIRENDYMMIRKGVPIKGAPRQRPIDYQQVWIKTVTQGEGADMALNELEILANADHPNLIKPIEAYQDDKYLHIVYEPLFGEDLIQTVVQNQALNEEQCREVMTQILQVLAFLH